MASIPLDTQKAIDKLKATRIAENQAKAILDVVLDAQAELVTKSDLKQLDSDLKLQFEQLEKRLMKMIYTQTIFIIAFIVGTILATVGPLYFR